MAQKTPRADPVKRAWKSRRTSSLRRWKLRYVEESSGLDFSLARP